MSQKLLSQGSFLEVADLQTPTEWIRVGGVTAINDLRSGESPEIDMTDLSSVERETALGLPDPGAVTAQVLFDPNDPGQAVLATLRRTRALNNFRVGAPNPLVVGSPTGTAMWNFAGRVRTFPFSFAAQSAQTGTVTIRVSGEITETL